VVEAGGWALVLHESESPSLPLSSLSTSPAVTRHVDPRAALLVDDAIVSRSVYLVLCGATFPIEFLDVLFVNRRAFMPSAASTLSVVRKTAA